jgi:methanogenic corrinoid protein MtbC1
MLGLGAATLRKVLANPLGRRRQSEPDPGIAFNNCASNDPMNVVLEGDIIPRLMLAHLVDSTPWPDTGLVASIDKESSDICAQDSERFASLPLRLEAPGLLEEVDRFLAQGVSVEEVYLDLLAPAARHLGELWNRDECDFIDVTMGLWRLQEVMREVSMRAPPREARAEPRRSALFCPVPGDVHSFGAQMIEEIFARAGWQSEALLQPKRRELLDYLSRRPLDLVGLTISRDCAPAAIASLIKAMRSVAINPNLVVLIGGQVVNQQPGLVDEVGADGTGKDAQAALDTADRLLVKAPRGAYTY